MKKVVFILTIILLLAVFCTCAFLVGQYIVEGQQDAAMNDELAQIKDNAQAAASENRAPDPKPDTDATEVPGQTTEAGGMLPGYKELYEMNPDMVGWLKIEGTQIDYPVMQTPNNPDFYLRRNFYREDSARGSLYAREACDINTPSDNITIYGHNMRDGSMFQALGDYVDKEAWEHNNLIFFDTLTEMHTYQIFAVFKTSANLGEGFTYHQFVDAATAEEFDTFVQTCKDLSFYDTGITPTFGDKMITLSTCEYTLDNGRLVVVAVRIS